MIVVFWNSLPPVAEWVGFPLGFAAAMGYVRWRQAGKRWGIW